MRGLAVFDMDGTLLVERTIDILTEELELKEELKKIDEKSKTLPAWKVSLEIAKMFKNYRASRLIEIFDRRAKIREGTFQLVSFFKKMEFMTAIISDSYTFLIERLARKLKIDEIRGNELEIKDGLITGNLIMPLGWQKVSNCKEHSICKLNALISLSKKANIPLDRTIAFGDTEGDFCMLSQAKIGVAVDPKGLKIREVANIICEKDFINCLDKISEMVQNI